MSCLPLGTRWPLSLSFRCVSGHLPRLALCPQAGDGQSRVATTDLGDLVDKVRRGQQWSVPTQKAAPTWVDTQGPAPGGRWASEAWGVVFSLEALTLGGETTPELPEAQTWWRDN